MHIWQARMRRAPSHTPTINRAYKHEMFVRHAPNCILTHRFGNFVPRRHSKAFKHTTIPGGCSPELNSDTQIFQFGKCITGSINQHTKCQCSNKPRTSRHLKSQMLPRWDCSARYGKSVAAPAAAKHHRAPLFSHLFCQHHPPGTSVTVCQEDPGPHSDFRRPVARKFNGHYMLS